MNENSERVYAAAAAAKPPDAVVEIGGLGVCDVYLPTSTGNGWADGDAGEVDGGEDGGGGMSAESTYITTGCDGRLIFWKLSAPPEYDTEGGYWRAGTDYVCALDIEKPAPGALPAERCWKVPVVGMWHCLSELSDCAEGLENLSDERDEPGPAGRPDERVCTEGADALLRAIRQIVLLLVAIADKTLEAPE